jgi:F-type H+-transporting ATPase subunit c
MEGTLNLVGYGLSAIGPGIGVGIVFAAFINGVARQPEARGQLQSIAFIGFALSEALAILGLVLAFALQGADPRAPRADSRTGGGST